MGWEPSRFRLACRKCRRDGPADGRDHVRIGPDQRLLTAATRLKHRVHLQHRSALFVHRWHSRSGWSSHSPVVPLRILPRKPAAAAVEKVGPTARTEVWLQCGRRDDSTLRRSFAIPLTAARTALAPFVFFDDRGLEPLSDQAENGSVGDAFGHHGHQLGMGDRVEGHHDTLPTSTVFPRRSPSRARTTRWWGKRWSCSVGRGANSACICSWSYPTAAVRASRRRGRI